MPRLYLIGIAVLVIVVVALGVLYGITNARLAGIMSQYETLKANYTNLQNQYSNLQGRYATLQAQYNQLETNYTSLENQYDNLLSQYYQVLDFYWDFQISQVNALYVMSMYNMSANMIAQLFRAIAPYDNITLTNLVSPQYTYFIIVPYGYNALVTINVTCTNTTSIGFTQAPFASYPFNPINITGSKTLEYIMPPGTYLLSLSAVGSNDVVNFTLTTVFLRDISNYLNLVRNENTYSFTTTVIGSNGLGAQMTIPIIVPYGYNITLLIHITSNNPMNIEYCYYNTNLTSAFASCYATPFWSSIKKISTNILAAPLSNTYFIQSIYIWWNTNESTVTVNVKPISITPTG